MLLVVVILLRLLLAGAPGCFEVCSTLNLQRFVVSIKSSSSSSPFAVCPMLRIVVAAAAYFSHLLLPLLLVSLCCCRLVIPPLSSLSMTDPGPNGQSAASWRPPMGAPEGPRSRLSSPLPLRSNSRRPSLQPSRPGRPPRWPPERPFKGPCSSVMVMYIDM